MTIYKLKNKLIYLFRTNRLILRGFDPQDLKSIYKYRNDVRCFRYQVYKDKTLEDLELYLKKLKSAKLGIGSIQLAVALKTTNKLIGDIFLDFTEDNISLGYTIDADFHRQGYGYEILVQLLKYLKDNFKQKSILAKVFIPNIASINLLHKLKFKRVGTIKKDDTFIFEYLQK
jgi:RimJ/RimL family protein N-acetyltransferase